MKVYKLNRADNKIISVNTTLELLTNNIIGVTRMLLKLTTLVIGLVNKITF